MSDAGPWGRPLPFAIPRGLSDRSATTPATEFARWRLRRGTTSAEAVDDEGLEILPTHRLVSGDVPEPDGSFRLRDVEASADAGSAALAALPRDHPAFVLLRKGSAQLAEGEGSELDTAVIDRLPS